MAPQEVQQQVQEAAALAEELTVRLPVLIQDLGQTSELDETESLRLQMALDRLSKLMTTLSNILKKMDDSAQSNSLNEK